MRDGLTPKTASLPKKFIAFEEQMSDEGAKARRADHEVNMRGPERMTPHCLEQLTRGTIIRNRIADRHDGSEPIGPCPVGAKARPQVPLRLIPVLDVVQLIGSRLPNLDQRPCNWLALGVGEPRPVITSGSLASSRSRMLSSAASSRWGPA